ncbi:hypothetical protein ABMY18_05460 [Vibrio vulnificus]|uniref:hypothetical protein n=1 Tax=Vibrio vulnificus TaxID=672 RepID=UPI000C9E13BA|nr:hypothetical protein [Vibrio vulnificus]EGQ9310787.1 hypothetical protein [Vibrio vulnificus]EGQ9829837.1 hypothetical protein [Vibrio vulnificus]EID0059695.1 hypothetical protein [Vibrio vulnificus]EID0715100.1 hypothetical protein [Vibrio vulnificus]EID0739273.1 hypothetical protein [Vibrio vulnificus]
MNTLTIYRKDLEFGLRSEGFTTRKIEQFLRVFNVESSSQGDMLLLDSTRAMLVNVNGTEQGLCLEDFITAWWVFWVVVFNQSTDNATHHQALGAIRALFFVSACTKSTSQNATMQMWWRDCEPLHGYPTMEAI